MTHHNSKHINSRLCMSPRQGPRKMMMMILISSWIYHSQQLSLGQRQMM